MTRAGGRLPHGLNCFGLNATRLGCAIAGALFAFPLARQRCLDSLLLTRLQIERVALDVFNDVFLQDFALEAPQRAVHGFAIL